MYVSLLNAFDISDGHLFDKEAILEYIIMKKNEISRKIKEYEKQCKKEQVSNVKKMLTVNVMCIEYPYYGNFLLCYQIFFKVNFGIL